MITNDKGLVELKHHVIREVCRQAWQGEITHDDRERIAREISPGPKPHYRCCVYREREIVRGRVRLAMGLSARTLFIPRKTSSPSFPPPVTTARSRTTRSRTAAGSVWAKPASTPAVSTPLRPAIPR